MTRTEAKRAFSDFCIKQTLEDLRQLVQVAHHDGSLFVFHNACVWLSDSSLWDNAQSETGYLGVATEHCGNQLFHVGDLAHWSVHT